MNERIYVADGSASVSLEKELSLKIVKAEKRLAILAQVVGSDFGMSVTFGKVGCGNFFDTRKKSITLDPQILLSGKEYLSDFIAGHEGGHRAITRSLEQIGVPHEKAVALSKKIGFGYLDNCLEDCADNRWVGELFSKFQADCSLVYAEQFEKENAAMTTPVIDRLIAQLGYTPKFVSFGSEIIRQWATGEYSHTLEPEVQTALAETAEASESCWRETPGIYSVERERLAKAKERFRIIYEKILPEFEKLVDLDVNEEKLRQLAEELNKKQKAKPGSPAEKGEKGTPGELPDELQKELDKKIEENLREQLKKLNAEIDKLKDQLDKAKSQEEKDKLAEQLAELFKEQESLEKGEKNVVPWDKLSDELKEKLREIFDKLPPEVKEKLIKEAKQTLEKLDDALIKESRGKLDDAGKPMTHEEIRAEEDEKARATQLEEARRAEEVKNEALAQEALRKIEGELSEYDRIYREVAPLADELFNRIHQIFLPRRHPRWIKNKPVGSRLGLFKVMQFQADRTLYDKLWETKTIPEKIDYRFTLLVDLSSSMSGEKIEQTVRGVMLLSEVLNRLGIKTQILGFQDTLIPYKGFDEELTPEIRTKMITMLKEVRNQGSHNQAQYNSDGYCLEQASELLSKQKGKNNFLVVFSDGGPAPDPAHRGKKYDLHQVIARIRSTRQKQIGVGLGPNTGHVADYYPTSLPNLSLKLLPQMLGELLEDMIKHPGKYQ